MHALRALLLALLVACAALVVLLPAPAAHACSCAGGGVRAHVENADAVLTGTLVQIDESAEDEVEYLVDVDRRYKGEDVTRTVSFTSAASGASCGLEGMETGTEYVFFLDRSGGGFTAGLCGGTAKASKARVAKVAKVLGPGSTVTAPPEAQRTVVEESEPASFTRLAAPGAAAVLVGLLGLVLVRAFVRDR